MPKPTSLTTNAPTNPTRKGFAPTPLKTDRCVFNSTAAIAVPSRTCEPQNSPMLFVSPSYASAVQMPNAAPLCSVADGPHHLHPDKAQHERGQQFGEVNLHASPALWRR